MPDPGIRPERSFTGRHDLLPSSNRDSRLPDYVLIDILPNKSFVSWTLSKGIVLWRIWPAVLLHTVFAAAIVAISLKTKYNLSIPSVLITVLGVVIGFVISYRASSGYDRYWAGRSSWSDIFRNSRTLSRLIWFHVPPCITPSNQQATEAEEAKRVMREKVMALDLVEGFVVALKHHLRGEIGIYYEDLYPLIRPLHDHPHHKHPNVHKSVVPDIVAPLPANVVEEIPKVPTGPAMRREPDHYIPPIGSYGSFHPPPHIHSSIAGEALGHHVSRSTRQQGSSGGDRDTSSSRSSEREPLLPSQQPTSPDLIDQVRSDLVPFGGTLGPIFRWMGFKKRTEDLEAAHPQFESIGHKHRYRKKNRPLIAGGGYNIPMETLRSLSDWIAVLEARGTVPGTTLGMMHGCIQSYETSLTALEQVLTTPLPFVYSVHISTVWIYLFTLPFQLVRDFRWYTIPGVAIASFIYLGFLAAGEEIEQPFGYDENDLDLDLFCRAIVHAEISQLKDTRAQHAFSVEIQNGEGAAHTDCRHHGIHQLASDDGHESGEGF